MAKKGLSRGVMAQLVRNTQALLSRADLMSRFLDPRRDIDAECGYPQNITPSQYRFMYDRGGIAKRVVGVWPEESWAQTPLVYETEDTTETAFEKAWNALVKKHNVFHQLSKVDELSGIGRFGILLIGVGDGKASLSEAIDGVPDDGELNTENRKGNAAGDPKRLLYLRAFPEDVVTVDQREANKNSPRFGKPLTYTVRFTDYEGAIGGGGISSGALTQATETVHWTRVIHVADNCLSSEVYGTPRMQPVFNNLQDIRKILSGSGEMFWKGAFPGYSFESHPDSDVEIDADSLRETIANYANGLQRYMTLVGMTARSLAPQVADPSAHLQAHLDQIAITLAIPKRVFFGSEEARLASSQDMRTWNRRVGKRQVDYVEPRILRPFVDRLIQIGVLPTPSEYFVSWPDLNTTTDTEKADVAVKRTQALAQYVSGGVEEIIPPQEYMTIVLEMEQEEVEQIIQAAAEHQDVVDEKRMHDAEIQAETNKLLAESAPEDSTIPEGE